VTVEVQEAIVGADSIIPAIADAVAASGMIGNIATLARAARAAGVPGSSRYHASASANGRRASGPSSSWSIASRRSMRVQKLTSPAPVSTMHRTSSSRRNARQTCWSSLYI